MHFGSAARQITRSLAAMLLGLFASSAPAQEQEFGIPWAGRANVDQAWVCRYTVEPDTAWYMRCHDLVRILDDDPVLNDDARSVGATLIPIWAAPFDDARPRKLARATLCRPKGVCTITLAAR